MSWKGKRELIKAAQKLLTRMIDFYQMRFQKNLFTVNYKITKMRKILIPIRKAPNLVQRNPNVTSQGTQLHALSGQIRTSQYIK